MARRAAALVLLVLWLAGCGSKSTPPIAQSALPKLVLQPADLPRVFAQFDVGAQVRADAPVGARSDPARFGREGGWKSRYHRAGTGSGPLVVESRADIFASRDGAKRDLDAFHAPGFHKVTVPRIGDATLGATHLQAGAPGVRYYTIAWRYRNVTASVTVSGFEGKLGVASALALARTQERHIEAAAHTSA